MGDPAGGAGADSWVTIDRKAAKKKPKPESEGAEEGWSQVGKDRKKKESTGNRPERNQDRSERSQGRPERNQERSDRTLERPRGERRGGDRGKPPSGARGGSTQRNTLPRKYSQKERDGGTPYQSQRDGGTSSRNTPSPAPKPVPGSSAEKVDNAPVKSTWATLVGNKGSPGPLEEPDTGVPKPSTATAAPVPSKPSVWGKIEPVSAIRPAEPSPETNKVEDATQQTVNVEKPPLESGVSVPATAPVTSITAPVTAPITAPVTAPITSPANATMTDSLTPSVTASSDVSLAESSASPPVVENPDQVPSPLASSSEISKPTEPTQLLNHVNEPTEDIQDVSVGTQPCSIPPSQSNDNNPSTDQVDLKVMTVNSTPPDDDSLTEPDGIVLAIDLNKETAEKTAVSVNPNLETNGNSVLVDVNKNLTPPNELAFKENYVTGPETRQYDRDILLQLQKHPLSMQKPDRLPQLEIVLANPMRPSSSAPQLGDMPSQYVHTFSRPPPAKRDSRRKESSVSKKIISISREPVKLHKADNAWVAGSKGNEEKESELDVLAKKVRAILNKLTPQKFEKLVDQFKLLPVDTEAKLVLCMELIFEKALDEPSFSKAYANMCFALSEKKVIEATSDKPIEFKSLLLRRCQKEFLTDYMSDEQRKKYEDDLNEAQTEDDKKRVKAEFEQIELKLRRRSLGNIRFISELYLLRMLNPTIMFAIIDKLIVAVDEESLECLCRLLTTSGAMIETVLVTEAIKEKFNNYFKQIGQIIEDKKISSRVRFLLQDVLDLRANKWLSRRKEAGPKTIEQIHKEAHLEALKIQLADMKPDPPVARRSEERSRRKTEYRPKPVSDEGWSNIPQKAAKLSDVVDPEKLRLRKVDADSIKLGPPSGARGFGWGAGSGASKPAETVRSQNRFHMFEDEEATPAAPAPIYAGRASEPVRNSYDRSISRGRSITGKPSSQVSSRDASVDVKPRVCLRGDVNADGDELRTKIKTLLEEYISNCDFKETFSSVCELFNPKNIEILVEESFSLGIDKKEKVDREQVGDLLAGLMEQGCLSVEQLAAGLGILLEIASDIIIDTPKFWEYLADILTRVLVKRNCYESIVPKCCSFLETKSMCENFIEHIHRTELSSSASDNICMTLRHKELVEGLLGRELEPFLAERNLLVTKPEPLVNGNLQEDLSRKLSTLLSRRQPGNDELSNVDRILCNQTLDKETVRTLVTAVIESAVVGLGGPGVSCSLDKDLLQARLPILKKYLDANKDRELFGLYAIQSLVNRLEHPNKLLHNILEILYDQDCISEDALLDWERSEDPEEQEGKGVALKSCTQFFDWLRTAEEDEEVQVA